MARALLRLVLASLIHPADRAGPGARLAEAVRTPGAVARERLRVRLPDGRLRWLEVLVRNLVDDPDVERRRPQLPRRHRARGGGAGARASPSRCCPPPRHWRTSAARSGNSTATGTSGHRACGRCWAWSRGRRRRTRSTLLRTGPPGRHRPTGVGVRATARGAEAPSTLDFRVVRPDGSHVEVHGIGQVESAADGRPGARHHDLPRRHRRARSRAPAPVPGGHPRDVREAIVVDGPRGPRHLLGQRRGQRCSATRPPRCWAAPRDHLPGCGPSGCGGPGDSWTRHGREQRRGDWAAEGRLGVRAGRALDRACGPAMANPLAYISLAIDATERRAARASLDRLWAAIEQSSESVVITDAEARIEYVNPAFERITGYSREEVVGQNPRILKSGTQPEPSTIRCGAPSSPARHGRRISSTGVRTARPSRSGLPSRRSVTSRRA